MATVHGVTGFLHQPEPNGSVYYTWSPATYLNLKPVSGEHAAQTASGVPVWLWAVMAIALAAGLFLIVKRRGSPEHTE